MLSLLTLIGFLAGAPVSSGEQATARENACIVCHENQPGRLSAVVEEWRRSMHAANKVTCDGCHGGEPALRRGQFPDDASFALASHARRDMQIFGLDRSGGEFVATVRGRAISYFCGKCHDVIKEKHLGSPHGGLGEPSCLYCHGQGSHAILEPGVDIIDTRSRAEGGRCSLCHRAGTMETVARIKTMLTDAQTMLATAVEEYAWLERHHYKNLALDRLYHHSKETVSQLRQTFHSFNMREITNFVGAIKGNADRTHETYELIADLAKAKVRQAYIGAGVVLMLLAFAGLLLHYRRTVLDRS